MLRATLIHHVQEKPAHATLDVWMMSKTGCSGADCEDKLGGTRIWCTNLCAGLSLLGHNVSFSTTAPRHAVDVLVVSSALLKKSKSWGADDKIYAKELARIAKVFVICKPNGVPIEILNIAWAVPYGSIIHLQTEISRGFQPERGWLAKHTEVPLEYWTFAEDQTHSMYHYIVKHEPRTMKFTDTRPARICYHGSHNHILSPGSKEVWEALDAVSSAVPLHVYVYSEGGTKPTLIDEKKVSIIQWKSVDDLFTFLRTCDMGIVPNFALPPQTQTLTPLPFPATQLTFKHSSNGGRAFVYAQVGVPVIGHPEFEFMEMLAVAGIDAMMTVAAGRQQWFHQSLQILQSPTIRRELSRSLRHFAENNLDIIKETLKFEERIIQRIEEHDFIHSE